MKKFKDLVLKGGSIATFVYVDSFDRPVYEIEVDNRTVRVCCTELNGTYLHTRTSKGEPIGPVTPQYQPKENQ